LRTIRIKNKGGIKKRGRPPPNQNTKNKNRIALRKQETPPTTRIKTGN